MFFSSFFLSDSLLLFSILEDHTIWVQRQQTADGIFTDSSGLDDVKLASPFPLKFELESECSDID